MFSNLSLDEPQINAWSQAFQEALPFRFLVIDDFLDPELARRLANAFPSLQKMEVNYAGLNERKSEHSNFELLHEDFNNLKKNLSSSDFTSIVERISKIENLETIGDRYGYGLHQGGKNSFLDIHVDYNLHPLRKKQRRLNLIIFLNDDWQEDWGGALEFWNGDVSECMQSILPVFNRCVLFECHDHSYHGYSKITCPETVTRKSFYLYYFSEPGQRLIFHDTIFRNKPKEPLAKKIRVHLKETTKNFIKRVFYYAGIKKFLK